MERWHSFYLTCSVPGFSLYFFPLSFAPLQTFPHFSYSIQKDSKGLCWHVCVSACYQAWHVGMLCSIVVFHLLASLLIKKKKKHLTVFDSPAISNIKHCALTQLKATRFAGGTLSSLIVFSGFLQRFTLTSATWWLYTYLHWTCSIIRYAVGAMHCRKKYLEEAGTMHTEDLFWMSLKSWDLVTLDLALVHVWHIMYEFWQN